MVKKQYDSATLEIVMLEFDDVVKTSNTFGFGDDTGDDIFD